MPKVSPNPERNVPSTLQAELAQNTISSCKVVVLKKIVQTVRLGGDHEAALKKLEKLKADLDSDFGLALQGDKSAIERGLGKYALFLRDYKEQETHTAKRA